MLPRLFFSPLLAMVSLCGIVSAAAVPEAKQALNKRALCGENLPGHLNIVPSTAPFLICEESPDVVSFIFQEDGNFVAYNGSHDAVWATNTGGHTCSGNNCTLAFQADGNLVVYYNRVAIWYTSTGADIGRALWYQNVPPFLYILNSENEIAWES